MIPRDSMLVRLTQQDLVYRRHVIPNIGPMCPDFGVLHQSSGLQPGHLALFCVERHEAWRVLPSKAGIGDKEYKSQRSILADVDAGRISKKELFACGE